MADVLREKDTSAAVHEGTAGTGPSELPRPTARREAQPKAPALRAVPPVVPTPATPQRRSRLLRLILMVVVPLLAAGGGLWFYLHGGRWVSTDNAYVQAEVLSVTTDVSGIVQAVLVEDNALVSAGDVLFRLDPEPFAIAVARAEAELADVRSELLAMQASYRQKAAEVEAAESKLAYFEHEHDRQSNLAKRNVAAAATLDQALEQRDSAGASLSALREEQGGIAARLGSRPDGDIASLPQYRAAEAAVRAAERDLRKTVVTAPMDGVVANVDALPVGSWLDQGDPAFSLVATDHLWVEANPKETQLTRVQPGQPVEIAVDTYPGEIWHGTVASISPASGAQFAVLPAQNTSGNWVKVVQRIPVRVTVDAAPGQPPLRVGMSVVIDIDTGHERTLAGLIGHAFAYVPGS